MKTIDAIVTVVYVITALVVLVSLGYLAVTAPDFPTAMTFAALAWLPIIAINQLSTAR